MKFKRVPYLDLKYRSEFSIWFSKNTICKVIGHKMEWWQVIERSKCDRCLSNSSKENENLEVFDKFMHKRQETLYRQLQTPFWKLSGMQLRPEEIEQEKYMALKGLDYYDVQRLRDIKYKAKAKKGVVDGRHLKAPESQYRRGES